MGSGIAQVAAVAGHDVVLRDVTDEALGRGRAAIEKSLSRFVAKGTLEQADAEAALGRITTTTDLDAVGSADVVVEAAFESIDVKQEVFRELDRICKDGAVLGTNTSAIPITQIAAVTESAGGCRRHPLLLAGADDGAVRAGPRLQDQRRDPRRGARLRRGGRQDLRRGQP